MKYLALGLSKLINLFNLDLSLKNYFILFYIFLNIIMNNLFYFDYFLYYKIYKFHIKNLI